MLFLQMSKHAPEICPMHDAKTKKALEAFAAKMGPLMKKYSIKAIGSWVSTPQHLIVTAFDAPNLETLLKLLMEPEATEWMSYNTSDILPVVTLEEAIKMLK